MAVLSHAFSVAAKEWEWLPESPMAKVKKPKVSNGRVLSERGRAGTACAAANASDNKFLPIVIEVAVATGMRYSEIMHLRWRDVLLDDQGRCSLAALEETKNGERRGVPLLGKAQLALDALRQAHGKAHAGKVNVNALLFPSTAKKDAPVELRQSWGTAPARESRISGFTTCGTSPHRSWSCRAPPRRRSLKCWATKTADGQAICPPQQGPHCGRPGANEPDHAQRRRWGLPRIPQQPPQTTARLEQKECAIAHRQKAKTARCGF